MPRRMMDGEAAWHSSKLKLVEPAQWRAEYFVLHPLALALGTFECDTERIWSKCYAWLRPDINQRITGEILDEFWRVKLLFCWTEPDGKVWGYWVGINKPGLLPKGNEYKYQEHGKLVPEKELNVWLGMDWSKSGERPDKNRIGLGWVGLGLGWVGKEVGATPENLKRSVGLAGPSVGPSLTGPVIEISTRAQIAPPVASAPSFSESQNSAPVATVSPEDVFSQARSRYRRIVGKNLGSWSSLGSRQGEWTTLVKREGETGLIAAIELWARENKDFLYKSGYPLAHFLKNSKDFIADSKLQPTQPFGDMSVNNEPEEQDDYARLLCDYPELAKKKVKI